MSPLVRANQRAELQKAKVRLLQIRLNAAEQSGDDAQAMQLGTELGQAATKLEVLEAAS